MRILTAKQIGKLAAANEKHSLVIANAVIVVDQPVMIPEKSVLRNVTFARDYSTSHGRLSIGNDVVFDTRAVIPPYTVIGDNVTFTNDVTFGDNCTIGNKLSTCAQATFCENVKIGDHAMFHQHVNFADYAAIGNHAAFASSASVGNHTTVGDDATFKGNLFGSYKFSVGRGAQFSGLVLVGDSSTFGHLCTFGGEVSVGSGAKFGDQCTFNDPWNTELNNAKFGAGCEVKDRQRNVYQTLVAGHPVFSVANVGLHHRVATFYNTLDGVYVSAGCFFGTTAELRSEVEARTDAQSRVRSMQQVYIDLIDVVTTHFNRLQAA